LNIQSLRGMPDLFPEDLKNWHILEDELSKLFTSFNCDEIRTPILESTDLFSRSVGGSSDIINKELYSFLDRNNESVSLRPEGSSGVVRAIIQKKQESERQKLWYQGQMFRYERPQKGRYRQFHQVGVEYLGYEQGMSEYELISMIVNINQSLGIEKYSIKINHLGSPEDKQDFCDALKSFLIPHEEGLHEKDRMRLSTNPLRVLDSKEESTKEILRNAPKYEDYISSEAKSFLGDLVDHYQDRCNIQIDSTLVRGLDYYTGIVFEVISEDLGAQDAYMGGGRYDNLSVQLGGKPMVAIGFAIGLERILELMTVKAAPHTIKVALIITLEHQDEKTYKIAHQLREANSEIILDAFLSNARLKSQLKRANKLNCDFAVIIGDEESNMNQVIWKDLSEHGDQKLLGIEDLLAVYKTL